LSQNEEIDRNDHDSAETDWTRSILSGVDSSENGESSEKRSFPDALQLLSMGLFGAQTRSRSTRRGAQKVEADDNVKKIPSPESQRSEES
jgi:hypothetical protein